MTKDQLIDSIKRMQGTQKVIAARLGVSQTYLSDVINGRRDPGGKMLDALRVEAVTLYRRRK